MFDTELLTLLSEESPQTTPSSSFGGSRRQAKALQPASVNPQPDLELAAKIQALYDSRKRVMINNIRPIIDHKKVARVPNFLQIEAGDLILFAPKNFDVDELAGYAIYRYQKEFYPRGHHACYTHAAVSLGGWELYESVTKHGVRRGTMIPYLEEGCEIRVRRLCSTEGRDWFNRVQIAINAAEMVGHEYSMKAILTTVTDFVRLKLGTPRVNLGSRSKGNGQSSLICSQLFVKACERLNINLNPGLPEEYRTVFTPASLSALDYTLQNVDLEWLELSDYLGDL